MLSVEAQLYVAPWGNDANLGTNPNQPIQTLQHAQAVVRTMTGTMTGDIVVNLRGGTYALASTWTLATADSGTNGHDVIWQAYPGEVPVLSGGQQITGWTLQDPVKNIWQASVGSLQFRQLYVNGQRANLARSAGGLAGSIIQTATGYLTTDTSLQNFRRPGDLEFVYSGPGAMASPYIQWIEDRISVAGISGTPTSTIITMSNAAWYTATHIPWSSSQDVAYPSYLENAYEFLSHPGDWYLDHAAGIVYYMPRAGERMATAQVIAPTLQTLVQGAGDSLAAPLQNVQFKGITFAYAGWLGPTREGGFVDWQADWRLNSSFQGLRMPASVVFQTAQAIRLEGDTFTHLGGAGLDLYGGSQTNVVIGNTFTDISGNGLQIGDISDPVRNDPRARDQYNLIADNYIHDVAVEYHGGVGIFLGYVAYTTVSHNEIYNVPYTGISLGWGWGGFVTYMQNNLVASNNVHDYMQLLGDGGALYTLSAQPNSTIADNWFHDSPMSSRYFGGAIYHDFGSAYFAEADNVMSKTLRWSWIAGAHDISLADNFTDSWASYNHATANIRVSNSPFASAGNWSALVLAIVNNAGVEAPWALHSGPFVTLGPPRNDFGGYCKNQVATDSSPGTASPLGRWVVSGNQHLTLVVAVWGAEVPRVSGSVTANGAAAGAIVFAVLAHPVVPAGYPSYYLVSDGTAGGDGWNDGNSALLNFRNLGNIDPGPVPGGSNLYPYRGSNIIDVALDLSDNIVCIASADGSNGSASL
jgi:hypothetical protein